MWKYTGQQRPSFAIAPDPGQESVWDYPRPPDIRADSREVVVTAGGREIARSESAARVCETASPPTFYLPPADITPDTLVPVGGQSYCEWKGAASYFALADDPAGMPVAWCYADPSPAFTSLRNWLCFYPDRVECFVAGERVRPQTGGFYGGWVTDEIVGPWKGEPGSGGW